MNSDKTADTQRKAARVAGFLTVLTAATGFFGTMYVRSNLVVPGNAAETANNIMASEQLFRIGAATDVITYALVAILALALYILLKPVSKNLALLGLCFRLGEAFMLVIMTLNSYIVLMLLSGADYLTVFETDQLQALVQLFSDAHETGYNIGLIFVFLGAGAFTYLFFKSNYIPRILAVWGILGCLVALIGTFAILVLPTPSPMLENLPYALYGVYEIVVGFWLLTKV
jgi:hypothetical protein